MDVLQIETEATLPPEQTVALPEVNIQKPGDFLHEVIKQGITLDAYLLYPDGGKPDYNTRAYLAFDGRNIYVAKEMEKKDNYELRARSYDVPDASIWNDDNVEIFLDPFISGQEYFQIIVNPLGEIWDSRWVLRQEPDPTAADPREVITVRQGDSEWSSRAETQVETGKDYWKIGIKMPFSAFGLEKAPGGGIWGANFCHSNRYNDQLSQWQVTPEGFHQPRAFGGVSFGKEVVDAGVEWNLPYAGYRGNYVGITFENPDSAVQGEASIRVATDEGEVIEEVRYRGMIDEGKSKIRIPFQIPEGVGGDYVISGRVEGGGLSGSFRRIVHLGEPVELHLKHELVYENDRTAEGSLMLNLGEKTLEETVLIFRIINDKRTVCTRIGDLKGNFINFGVSTGLLHEGDNVLEVEAVAAGKSVMTKKTPITLMPPPFAF